MLIDARIAGLRRHIESLETAGIRGLADGRDDEPKAALVLGQPDLDACFTAGGLAWGVHQFAASEGDPAISRALSFMLLARYLADHTAARDLIVQEASALRETGSVYGPGLHALGLDPGRLVFLQAPDGAAALRAINEALRARVPDILIADLCNGAALADLSVTRRFNLAAHKARALVLLTTPDLSSTSAALTRWRVASASSLGARRRLGAPTFSLELVRNRHGRTGRWILEWNSHDRIFQSLRAAEAGPPILRIPAMAASLVAPAFDRSRQAGPSPAVLSPGDYRQAG